MLFQVVSDLHLEVAQQYSTFELEPKAPYLILAGDIGRLSDYDALLGFLERQCAKFTRVFMVLGNHEFYAALREFGIAAATRLEAEPQLQGRFVLLNRTVVNFCDGTVLLGCTLHSHISDSSRSVVEKTVQDFARITNWTVDDHNAEHAKDASWLRAQIERMRNLEPSAQRRRIVVVTHYAPTRKETSKPEHENNAWSDAFATDLLSGSGEDNVLLSCDWWIYGHTHYSNYFQIGAVQLFSNQRGYVFPWTAQETTDAATTQTSMMRKLRARIGLRKSGTTSARGESSYEKQMRHEFDAGATIRV